MKALEANINSRLSRLDHVPTIWQMSYVVAAGVVAILGILAFGGDRFNGGVQFSSTAIQQTLEAKALSEKTAQQLAEQQRQIDQLLPLLTRLLEKEQRESNFISLLRPARSGLPSSSMLMCCASR